MKCSLGMRASGERAGGPCVLAVGRLGMLLLVLFITVNVTRSTFTRRIAVSVGPTGGALTSILPVVSRSTNIRFSCSLSLLGTRARERKGVSNSLARILSAVLRKAKVDCAILGSGEVTLSHDMRTTGPPVRMGRCRLAKAMSSTVNPLPNITIVRDPKGKAMASLSNGCDVGIGASSGIDFGCVNCIAIGRGITKETIVSITVQRSTARLRRLIIINCHAMGGVSLAKTISSISVGEGRSRPVAGSARVLCGAPNL